MIQGEPRDLDKWLGRAKKRVHRVGVELEGGWSALPDKTKIIRDGSVMFDDRTIMEHNLRYIGELPSPPLEPPRLAGWLRKFYPPAVNATCGMHVHMSFRNVLEYQKLMTPEFMLTGVEYLKRWANDVPLDREHPIWNRLAGANQFCTLDFYADQQVLHTQKTYGHEPGCRYTAVHYPFARMQTIEWRVLPMMADADLALSAIQRVIDITNAFLLSEAKREAKLNVEVPVEDLPIREELIECV